MVKFDVEGVQNAEVSKKLPPEKSPMEQLELMERYTDVHRAFLPATRERREVECLKVLYPALLRGIEPDDLFAGRLDFLPIGFGCVTSVGGVGHYCVFSALRALQSQMPAACKQRFDALYDYWLCHDLKTVYCGQVLTEDTVGRFIDCEYPLIATARLSGMMLDYRKLMELGIGGLRAELCAQLERQPDNPFLSAGLECLGLFCVCARHLGERAKAQAQKAGLRRAEQLARICESLEVIEEDRPQTFHQALQLFWLYALLAGVINYGRMDDVLGPFLSADLDAGRLSEDDAYAMVKSLWRMIENRRTTVNGRIIVGGRGRQNSAAADRFVMLCLRAAKECRYVEPQFTLRFDAETDGAVWGGALDALADGATYPTLYNDDVNIPAVEYGMRIDRQAAEQYVPFGCTEFVIQGQSVGTPNVCVNLLKLLTVALNGGIDPMDKKRKNGAVGLRAAEEYRSFEEFYTDYKALLDYYMDLAVEAQKESYRIMNGQVSFLFTSLLMADCIGRGRALLDGGVRYLGGTCETYGNINASDSLWAIKHLVFDTKKYTLPQLRDACAANFEGYGRLRRDCLAADKYGNDLDTADTMALQVYNYVAKGIRSRGIAAGLQYYLIVISNNQVNTDWGLRTAASPDGRLSGVYMNPANNPQGGADRCGPTAMLNSLVKFSPRYHAGSVQNIKLTPRLFRESRDKVSALFAGYFAQGGCQLMVTVVDKGVLEDAVLHPEKYPNLLVRVSGFSAVFVDLPAAVQREVMSRVLYD